MKYRNAREVLLYQYLCEASCEPITSVSRVLPSASFTTRYVFTFMHMERPYITTKSRSSDHWNSGSASCRILETNFPILSRSAAGLCDVASKYKKVIQFLCQISPYRFFIIYTMIDSNEIIDSKFQMYYSYNNTTNSKLYTFPISPVIFQVKLIGCNTAKISNGKFFYCFLFMLFAFYLPFVCVEKSIKMYKLKGK